MSRLTCSSPPEIRSGMTRSWVLIATDRAQLLHAYTGRRSSMTASQPESVTAPVVPRCLALRLQTVLGALEPDPRGYIRRRTNDRIGPQAVRGSLLPVAPYRLTNTAPFAWPCPASEFEVR